MQPIFENNNDHGTDFTSEAESLLCKANKVATVALENLARIQGEAFRLNDVRELFPLLKVYFLFPNLEESERSILVGVYQSRYDANQTETLWNASPSQIREKVQAAGFVGKLTAVQREILEREFLEMA